MFEKMRDTWTKMVQPLVVRMGDLDPSVLTWTSLAISIVSFYLIAIAELDKEGAMMITGAVALVLIAGIFDALDGALARHQGTAGPYGDFLDHTIDRVVDVGLVVAIGYNSAYVVDPLAGWAAALLTLLGSYMGTQAQSVGLGRIYGSGGTGIDISSIHEYAHWALLGNAELNGMTLALAVSLWGGVYTFLVRFMETRKGLLAE